MTCERTKVNEGEWIEARVPGDHRLIGYVVRVDERERMVLVRIVDRCCSRVSPHEEWVQLWAVKRLPESNLSNVEGYLLNAIDFALDTGDRDEFFRRTGDLRSLRGLPVYDTFRVNVKLTL
jgi:hypothetical protein